MCGIVGSFGFVDEDLLKSMCDSIEHRGPDGEGFYVGKDGALGSRRLAIIDVSGGQMPISNESGDIWVVYNGEIYNHAELTDELIKLGHIYKTRSDTEMVLHAYEEWGPDCVKRFNGMFGFAIYDGRSDTIFAARDQFGIKPFYYTKVTRGFLFSSEIKAFLKSFEFKPTPNETSIYKYMAYRKHDDSKETFFDGVTKLMPGEYAIFSRNGNEVTIKTSNYFDLDINTQDDRSDAELIETFKHLFIKSVKDRLMSEVPVGSCLSGGLDSSAVVCVINKLMLENSEKLETIGDKQTTFSAVFPSQINNEEEYINVVLDQTKTEKNFSYPQSRGLFEELDSFIYSQEEPFISSGPYAQWCVMRDASKKVKVLLDGQGSDEMLAGYTPYLIVYLRQLLSQGKVLLFVKELIYCLPQIKNLIIEKIKGTLEYKFSLREFVSKDFVSSVSYQPAPLESKRLKKRLKADLFYNSIPSLLRYEDKNSMAFSIEGRVPFLDPELVKFVFTLPERMLIRNGYSKYILREALKGILPEKILNRKWKVGFTTPEVAWFRDQREKVYDIVNSDSFRRRKYFDHNRILRFVNDFYDGKHNESMVIWRWVNLELWLRLFIDNHGKN